MTTTPVRPDEPGELRRRTVNSAFWVAADRWINRLSSLVVFAIIGRLLGASEIGLAALAATFVALFQVFSEQGFSDALVQRKTLDDRHADSAFWVSVGSAVALIGVLELTAGLIAEGLHTPALAPVLRVLAVTMLFSALSSTPAALLERDFGFKQLTRRRVVANLAGAVAGVTLAFCHAGVWAVVFQSVVSSAVGVVILWSVVPWRPRLRVSRSAVRDLRQVGFGVIGIQVFAFVNNQADKLVIGAFISPAALGYYYIGMRMISILGDVQTSVIQAVSLTALSRVQDDKARFRRAFLALTGTAAAIGVFTYATFAALAPVVIPLVFGPQWHASIVIAQILCLMGALNSVIVFDRSALIAIGRSGLAFSITVTQSLVGIAAVLAAVPFGIVGVAIGVSVRQYLVWPFRLRALRRAVGLPVWLYLRQWVLPAIGGVVVFAVVGGAVQALPTETGVWELLATTVVGGIAAAVLYLAVGRLLFRDILAQFVTILRRRKRATA